MVEGLKRLHPQLKDLSEQLQAGEYLVIVPNGANTPVRIASYEIKDGIFEGYDEGGDVVLMVDALKVIVYHESLVHQRTTEELIREAHADEHAATEFRKVLHPDDSDGKVPPSAVYVAHPDGTVELPKTGQYL